MKWLKGVGIFIIMVSTLCGWIKAPLSGDIPIREINFIVSLLIIASTIAVCSFRSNTLSTILGMICFSLAVFFLLHLSLIDPIIWHLADENNQYANIIKFTDLYFPPNFGKNPNFGKHLMTLTLIDRVGMAFYFIDWGWWLCLFGSLLLFMGSIFARPALAKILPVSMLLLVCHVGFLSKGIMAQYLWEQANSNMGRGCYAQASRQYKKIIASNTQLAGNEAVFLRLGEAYYHMGHVNVPGALFYIGNDYENRGDFEQALSEYRLAAKEAVFPLQQLIYRHMARLHTQQGLRAYQTGLTGQACSQWEMALSWDPKQYEAIFYLTKGYFDQGKYKKCIEMGNRLLADLKNQLLHANIHSSLGDGYWKIGELHNARQAYEKSMKLDEYGNLRIFKSLGGT